MTTKEILFKEIEQIPEPYWEQLLKVVQAFKKKKVRTFKGRPLLSPEDVAKMDCLFPPEPGYEELWEEREKG